MRERRTVYNNTFLPYNKIPRFLFYTFCLTASSGTCVGYSCLISKNTKAIDTNFTNFNALTAKHFSTKILYIFIKHHRTVLENLAKNLGKWSSEFTGGRIRACSVRGDVRAFEEDQWDEALAAVPLCSLNVAQRLSQLYVLLRVHYTPARLVRMGVREDPSCSRCMRDHGDLIHMLWRSPKLHIYWREVVKILNRVFQIQLVEHPKLCGLGIIDEIPAEESSRLAITRALFQARLLILGHWKSTNLPTVKEWLAQMGNTIRLEKYIYQHRGSAKKFEKIWVPWLAVLGLAPVDLIMDCLLM